MVFVRRTASGRWCVARSDLISSITKLHLHLKTLFLWFLFDMIEEEHDFYWNRILFKFHLTAETNFSVYLILSYQQAVLH